MKWDINAGAKDTVLFQYLLYNTWHKCKLYFYQSLFMLQKLSLAVFFITNMLVTNQISDREKCSISNHAKYLYFYLFIFHSSEPPSPSKSMLVMFKCLFIWPKQLGSFRALKMQDVVLDSSCLISRSVLKGDFFFRIRSIKQKCYHWQQH